MYNTIYVCIPFLYTYSLIARLCRATRVKIDRRLQSYLVGAQMLKFLFLSLEFCSSNSLFFFPSFFASLEEAFDFRR